jgi:uncharacterized protein (TIRG00374 family)
MNHSLKKVLQIIFPIALGGFILFWVYRDFDFTQAFAVLVRDVNWGWMSFSLIFGVFSQIIRGWRWKQLLEPVGELPPTSRCIYAVFVSYAVNLVIPRLGEISRCSVLAKYGKVPFSKSLGTLITDQLIDALCVVCMTVIALLLQFKVFNRFFAETGTNVSGVFHRFASVHLYLVLADVLAGVVLLYFLLHRLSFFKKIKGTIRNVWAGMTAVRKVRNLPLFILCTFLIWLCYFMFFYVAFFCFPFTAHLSIGAGLAMFIGGTFSALVPAPTSAGPWHFVIISMMSLYGVNALDAGIFALLVHGVQTFLVVLLGVYGMAMLSFTNKDTHL